MKQTETNQSSVPIVLQQDKQVKYISFFIIILILLFSAYVRSLAINRGHFDERRLVYSVARMFTNNDLDPRWYGHPGSFTSNNMFYVDYAAMLITYPFTEGFNSLKEYRLFLLNDYSGYRFAWKSGRVLMVITATMSVCLVYLLAKKLVDNKFALLSAFVFAISPLHIQYSSVIRTDTSCVLTVLAACIFLVYSIDNPGKKRYLILSALFCGFAISTKYPMGLMLVPLLIHSFIIDISSYRLLQDKSKDDIRKKVHKQKRGRRKEGKAIQKKPIHPVMDYFFRLITFRAGVSLVLLFAFIGLFMFAPYVIIKYHTALAGLTKETSKASTIGSFSGLMKSFHWYLKGPLNKGAGGLFFSIIALFGFIMALIRRKYKYLLLLIFPVLLFIVIGIASIKWHRWAIPILPFEAILFSFGITEICFFLSKAKWPSLSLHKWQNILLIIVLIFACPVAVGAIKTGLERAKPTTKHMVYEWFYDNTSRNNTIAYEKEFHMNLRGFRIVEIKEKHGITVHNWRQYAANHINYVVLEKQIIENMKKNPNKFKSELQNYEQLSKQCKLVYSFSDGRIDAEIYRIPR